MIIYKTYKFRMYPTSDQVAKIMIFFKAKRFIYNNYINEMKKNEVACNKSKYLYSFEKFHEDLIKLKKEYPWLNDVDGCIIRTTLQDVNDAYEKYYRGEASYPKYKNYYQSQTYKTVCIYHNYRKTKTQSIEVNLVEKTIKLPKLNEVKISGYRKLMNFEKKILSVIVKKIGKKYYAQVLVKENWKAEISKKNSNNIVGIDLGVKNIITTSDGVKYPSLNIGRIQMQIKLLQKRLSSSQSGSKNHKKITLKIQRKYQIISNKRLELINLITNDLVKKYDILVVENLSVKEMLQKSNSSLSNKMQNSSFYEIIKQLERKAYLYGKKVIKIDRFFPSSQLCSKCGYRNKDLKNIDIRTWICPKCDSNNDRDINASINIMKEGKKIMENNW